MVQKTILHLPTQLSLQEQTFLFQIKKMLGIQKTSQHIYQRHYHPMSPSLTLNPPENENESTETEEEHSDGDGSGKFHDIELELAIKKTDENAMLKLTELEKLMRLQAGLGKVERLNDTHNNKILDGIIGKDDGQLPKIKFK